MAVFKTRLHELMQQHGLDRTEVVRQAILKGHRMSYQTVRIWDIGELTSIGANAALAFMDVFDCSLEDLVSALPDEPETES